MSNVLNMIVLGDGKTQLSFVGTKCDTLNGRKHAPVIPIVLSLTSSLENRNGCYYNLWKSFRISNPNRCSVTRSEDS